MFLTLLFALELNSYRDCKFKFQISNTISLTSLKNKGHKGVYQFFHFQGVMSAGNISVLFPKQKSKGHRPTKRQGMDILGNCQIHPIKEFKILTTILFLIYLIWPKSLFPKTTPLWAFASISISQIINECLMKLRPNMKTGSFEHVSVLKHLTLIDVIRNLRASAFGTLYSSSSGKTLKAKVLFIPFSESLTFNYNSLA